jgi:hypothetical protein
MVATLKAEVMKYNTEKVKIKEWENDLRKINPNPEDNEALDE